MRPIILTLAAGTLVLAGCDTTNMDLDLRDVGRGFDTSSAALQATTAARPQPDARGVISYPNYQVAVASRGDTVADVATRVGLPAEELARYNGVPVNAVLNAGEIIALPRRVAEPATGPIQPVGAVDIQTLAGSAIERAAPSAGGTQQAASTVQTGEEPVRHKVEAGETAYSISRLYGVSAKSLGDWNGLGPDLTVRTGQYLLIPVVVAPAATPENANSTTQPGQGSPTPTPPSAATALPDEKTEPASKVAAATQSATPPKAKGTPDSPDLGKDATSASTSNAAMSFPASGSIVGDFRKGKNDGIDIAAPAGSAVKAADSGTVAAITEDTDQVPILILRHSSGLMTVYANVDNLKVRKGQSVKRGQAIATVRESENPYLHFEVRDGFEAVDPTPYLQ